jgi:hypothetical protein
MAASVAASLLIVAALALTKKDQPEHATPAAPAGKGQGMFTATVPGAEPGASGSADLGFMRVRPMGKQPSALDAIVPPAFKADANGRLLVNPTARNDMEQVVALYGREDAMAKLAEATKDLPPQAQRDVRDLYQQYLQYSQALSQAVPAGQSENLSLDEARAQFDTIKKLRAQYFGANTEAMFKEDHLLTDKILDYAAEYLQQHPGASLQDATGYGQEKVLSAPEGPQAKP